MNAGKCILCAHNCQTSRDLGRDMLWFSCETCGEFGITPTAQTVAKPQYKLPLSCVTRRTSDGGGKIEILTSNIEQLIKALPQFSPSEKLDNALEIVAKMSPGIGIISKFNAVRDYPLLIPSHLGESDFLLTHLANAGYLGRQPTGQYVVTMSGWKRIEEIRRSGRDSSRCFVAMWFDASMNPIYDDAIRPAIVEAGYDSLRIDKLEHTNRIDDEIISQIKRSRFMVADFTGLRSGVYFEAGLMQGIGRNVIWMCKNEVLESNVLHFDIRQFNFIGYSTPEEARTRLYNRIIVLEGGGSARQ